MMRKRFLSLTCALVLCLSLLPVTALAANGGTVYVGGVMLSGSTDSPAYATTDDNGTVTTVDASADKYNIKWDGSTLTLDGAKIKGGTSSESLYATVGIYAFSNSGDVSLNIALKGVNEIFDSSHGIWVYSSSSGTASLDITGENGSTLIASGSSSGILVQSNSGEATLTIQNADVTAENSSSSGDGVTVRAGSSSSASLSVDGGSLTATGKNEDCAGIRYTFGSSSFGSGKPSLTVSGNTIVRANGGISDNSSTDIQIGGDNNSSGGIVFDGNEGTVYGSVTLQEDLTVENGQTLTIPDGASLTIGNDATLTNEGTVTTTDGGTLTNEGTINNSGTLPDDIQGTAPPRITTTSLAGGTVGTAYTATLAADGEPTSWTWSAAAGSNTPPGLTLNNGGTITGTPTMAGTSTFTVNAKNSAGSDSKEYTLTIQSATVPVTGVKLNTETLELFTSNTATLTATVEPDNATNKAVTWTSSNPSVATVENGVVTAVAPGTAVITVTTADGSKQATCSVTVTRPYIPPANPNYRITVEATQGGTVTADPTAAKAGATVTLTPVPDRGYQVGTVAVTDRFGEPVAVTEQAGGTYTFTMPNGQVTVTVTFEQAPLPFPDVTEGDWFYDAVRYAYENGLMDGVGDNLFAPNSETTRAQLVTILYRLAGEPEPGGDSGFSDVAAGIWYTDAVAWAAQNGIVNGVSDTEFVPGDDITREQLATILYRYAAYQGYDVSQRADLSGFGDASSISGYAQEALSWAHAQGLVLGFEDGSLRPQGTASRAQIAAVLMRFLAAVPTA